MLATSARLSHDRDGALLLTLYGDGGSSICAVIAPEILPDLARAFDAETRRRALDREAMARADAA